MQAEFDVDGADAESDLAIYDREIETVRQTTRGHPLDEIFVDPNRKAEMSLLRLRGYDPGVNPS
jgi:hypothetical protein